MSEKPTVLPTGKLPAELLAELISTLPIDDPDLFLGPGIGEDAAIIEIGGISGRRRYFFTRARSTHATGRRGQVARGQERSNHFCHR